MISWEPFHKNFRTCTQGNLMTKLKTFNITAQAIPKSLHEHDSTLESHYLLKLKFIHCNFNTMAEASGQSHLKIQSR